MEKILTVRMVAAALHRHENTIYRYLQENVFPSASRIRGGYFIPESDVRRLLRNGRAAGADQRSATHR